MKRRTPPSDLLRDPFRERDARARRWRVRVLGASCDFTSNSDALLGIAREAFDQVPQHRWPRAPRRRLRIELRQVGGDAANGALPPKPSLSSGAGLLCAHVDSRNFVIVDPRAQRALIQVDDSMLRHRRLLRYEFLEFAVLTLAARTQGLVPLHGGCVGVRGRGVLLLGSSGAGKSTLALQAALDGLDFLAEDSVFVQPETLRATGLSAFVHACDESLGLFDDRKLRRRVRAAPTIERRSGVRKRELDLRGHHARLAPRPLRIVAAVVLSARRARGKSALVPLSAAELRQALRAEQVFAAGQPGWQQFERGVLRAGGFRLDRVPPGVGVSTLRRLLEGEA